MSEIGSSLIDQYEEKFMASVREKAQTLQDSANEHLEYALTERCPGWRNMERSELAKRLRSEVLVDPGEVRYYFDGELFFTLSKPRTEIETRCHTVRATVRGGYYRA